MTSLSTEILFEKFQIIEVMKKDEHAAVFLANHIYLNKKIILKVLNTQKIHDSSMVERFKREAKILAKLDHPNIIKVLDFGMSKEFFYISFEYIEGESLRNAFKTKIFTQEQKEHVMIQLLKGLDYAHANQIIHRDIKPENIFIDKNLNVKLGDFGLALSAEDNYVTNPYSIVGTPSYMSPEQVRGAKLTAQSDLFSLGVVLFELYTGINPFLKENVSLTLNEINSYNEHDLDEKLSNVQQNIKEILLKLLKKNINQRYNSAAEILEELDVQFDQPNIVISSIDREGVKTKLAWTLITVLAIVLIVTVVIPLIKDQGQDSNQQSIQQGPDQIGNNISTKNNSVKSNNPEDVKDKVDLNNLNKPLVDNQKKNDSTKPQSDNQTPAKTLGYGGLFVYSIPPYVDIYINGQKFQPAPLKDPIRLLEGSYSVYFANPDYPPSPTQIVHVKADSVTTVKINLNYFAGFIYVRSNPWGEVFVNNESVGEKPRFIRVIPGLIHVVVKNPSYSDIDTFVNVRARDTLQLNLKFKK